MERTCDATEATRGEIEEALAEVWREVFHLEKLGRDDNFFELGGDSVLAMKLTEALEHHLDIRLPVVAIFQNPSVRELALFVAEG